MTIATLSGRPGNKPRSNDELLQHYMTMSHIQTRNIIAAQLIEKKAKQHGKMDMFAGFVSGLFGTGASLAALPAQIAVAYPIIYKPLVAGIGRIYLASPDRLNQHDPEMKLFVLDTTIDTICAELVAEFSVEFATEIAQELLQEAGMAVAAMSIPLVGAPLSAFIDAHIAYKMTWRVGAMAAIYYQNGGQWVEDRKTTFHIAKKLVGPFKFMKWPTPANMVDLDTVPAEVSTVLDQQMETAVHRARGYMRFTADWDQIAAALREDRIDEAVITKTIEYLRANA